MTAPGSRIGRQRSPSSNGSAARVSATSACSRHGCGPASRAPTSRRRFPAGSSTGCPPAVDRAAANVWEPLRTVARRIVRIIVRCATNFTQFHRRRSASRNATHDRLAPPHIIRCATSELGGGAKMKITAAVVNEKSGPFEFRELELEAPRSDEVLVRIVATGICQTDLHVRDQEYPVPLPAVLGHEGAGVVEAVGGAVCSVGPGDHVILSYQACGHCRPCLQGSYSYCERAFEANFGGARLDGSNGLRHNGAGPDVH